MTIILTLSAAVILAAIAKGLWDVCRAVRSRSWPSVEGSIIRSEVTATKNEESELYAPLVEYRYTVDGKEFSGRCIRIGVEQISMGWIGFARRFVERYQPGQRVAVSYNLSHPASAVLEPGVHKQVFFILGGALGVLIFGLSFLDHSFVMGVSSFGLTVLFCLWTLMP
jgi:hypothetical protein